MNRGSGRSAQSWPLGVALALGLALCSATCGHAPADEVPAGWIAPPEVDETSFEVPPPPFTEGAFPCSSCHEPELPFNPRRRKLKIAHQEIELRHDEQHRWCLDCHDPEDRDQLHLAGGEKVPFEQSYRLCGQCHGEKYRDWRAGVHGRRTGRWDGEKQYLLCVHCHNSHRPQFLPIAPEPPPTPPRRTP